MIEELLIIGLRVYGTVVAFLLLNILSRLVFGEVKLVNAIRSVFAIFSWPLFMFSIRGRKKLIGRINKL